MNGLEFQARCITKSSAKGKFCMSPRELAEILLCKAAADKALVDKVLDDLSIANEACWLSLTASPGKTPESAAGGVGSQLSQAAQSPGKIRGSGVTIPMVAPP